MTCCLCFDIFRSGHNSIGSHDGRALLLLLLKLLLLLWPLQLLLLLLLQPLRQHALI